MSPIANRDFDTESMTSGQDSPLRRQSSPMYFEFTSTRASHSPDFTLNRSKCNWCGKYFERLTDLASDAALQDHIATAHPHTAKFAMIYDGAADDEADSQLHEGSEDAETADEIEDGAVGAESTMVDGPEAVEVASIGSEKTLDTEQAEAEAEAEEEDEGHDGDSDLALSKQLHEFSQPENSVSAEKRLHHFWSIHDADGFSENYSETADHLEETWDAVFRDPKRSSKRGASDIIDRPIPYKKDKVNKGQYLDISAVEDFLVQLRDPESRSVEELYAITENVAHALKVWQDEYFAIDKLHRRATRHTGKPSVNPQSKAEHPGRFEDKKEAMLYGFKYDQAEGKILNQDSFSQGGFKPTAAQLRKMKAKNDPKDPNPDGWQTIKKLGAEWYPVCQYVEYDPKKREAAAIAPKVTRKRKAEEIEAATRATETSDAVGETPAPAEAEEMHPAKRRTRNRRAAETVEEAAPPTRGNGRGRGRGGGRGSRGGRGGRGRGTSISSRGPSETPQPSASSTPAPPAPSSGRGRGASGRGTSTRGRGGRGGSAKSTTASAPSQKTNTPAPTAASQPAPALQPAPNGTPAAAPSGATPAAVPAPQIGGFDGTEALDPVEIARRNKIAHSKNPKRTEAMLKHWARFNSEGRTRNPKRTKKEIAEDAARKALEPPKPVGRKKSQPFVPGPEQGIAPAPPAPPAQMIQATPLPLPPSGPLPPPVPGPNRPQLAPLPPPPHRLPMAPFPPIDHRAVPQYPHSPYGPIQQAPSQMPYQTPYPEHFMPFGPPASMPPPPPPPPHGHPRP